jgi:hypothetical protein
MKSKVRKIIPRESALSRCQFEEVGATASRGVDTEYELQSRSAAAKLSGCEMLMHLTSVSDSTIFC